MIENIPTLFSTLKVQNGSILALDAHINKLKSDYLSLFRKKWIFEKKELFEFLSHHELSDGVYRLNIFATSPNSFKKYLHIQLKIKLDTSIKIYPKSFTEKLAHFKKTRLFL